MKKLILFVALALLATVYASAQKAEKREKPAKTETAVFNVSMDCENCVAKIRKQLSFEKGVKDLYISLNDKLVAVKFQPLKTDGKKLTEAMEKIGYEVSELPTKEKLPEAWKK